MPKTIFRPVPLNPVQDTIVRQVLAACGGRRWKDQIVDRGKPDQIVLFQTTNGRYQTKKFTVTYVPRCDLYNVAISRMGRFLYGPKMVTVPDVKSTYDEIDVDKMMELAAEFWGKQS